MCRVACLIVSLLFLSGAIASDVGQWQNEEDEWTWERKHGSYPYRSFRTVDLISPAPRRVADSPLCVDDNYIFLAPRGKRVKRPAVAILDNQGDLVWEHQVKGEPYNLEVQKYKDEQVLTFWVGDDTIGGHGEGTHYVYNSKYEEIAQISAGNGLKPDLHELIITPGGTAIVTIFSVTSIPMPGPFGVTYNRWIWDCLFQEIDIATQDLLFEWRASDHHAVNETYRDAGREGLSYENAWDWFHINSVQKDGLGNYLVSARYTSTITYVNGSSGHTIWVLGGKQNIFEDLSNGQATNMAYQHIARFQELTMFPTLLAEEIKSQGLHPDRDGMTRQLLTAFDNGADHDWSGARPPRGVLLEVTYPTEPGAQGMPYTARLIKSYEHPAKFLAVSQGSMQLVPGKDGKDPRILLGYGDVGVWAEFSAEGQMLCDTRFGPATTWGNGHVQNYRTLKAAWVGRPSQPPAVVFGHGSRQSLLVSWNGATEVRSWKVQGSDQTRDTNVQDWTDLATSDRKGFETEIEHVASSARLVRVVAFDGAGQVLGSSEPIKLGWRVHANKAMNRVQNVASRPLVVVMMLLSLGGLVLIWLKGFRHLRFWPAAKMFSGHETRRPAEDGTKHA